MEGKERLQDYLIAVAGCIRWKRARGPLLRELSDHIEDQKKDFSALGMSENEAMERSINEMGDPVTVGKELDRLHRPKTSWGLILFTVLAVGLGLTLLSPGLSRSELFKQFLALGISLPVMLIVAWNDYTLLIRKTWPLVAAFICLLVYFELSLTRLDHRMGFYRYVIYGALLLPVLFSFVLCRLRGKGLPSLALCALLLVAMTVPPFLAPSFSTVALIVVVMTVVLCAAVWWGWFKVKRSNGLLCACAPLFLGFVSYFNAINCTPFLSSRLSNFFHPELDPLGKGFSLIQVRNFFSQLPFLNTTGELMPATGAPFGDVELQLHALAARFGWVVFVLAGILIMLATLALFWRVSKLKSIAGRLVALSAGGVLIGQMTVSLLLYGPLYGFVSGIPFPILSYCPALLAADLLLIAVLLSVFRMDALVRDVTERKPAPTLSIPEQLHIPLGPWDIHIEKRDKI